MSPDPYTLLNSHIGVSHETFERLKIYHDLLIKWQKKINLVSDDTIDDIWSRHFLDSLQLKKFIPTRPGNILDIGSGAGFPGMVLAISGIDNILLIESDAKKVAFLREVSRETKSTVSIVNERAEKYFSENNSVILSRAVASLCDLFETISPNVSHETICLFPKGKNYAKELEDAKKKWQFNCDILPSITDANAVILRISNLQGKKSVHGKLH